MKKKIVIGVAGSSGSIYTRVLFDRLIALRDGKLVEGGVKAETTQVMANIKSLLAEHGDALLGPAPESRGVRIMVTMPVEAAHDPAFVEGLLARGMDRLRSLLNV